MKNYALSQAIQSGSVGPVGILSKLWRNWRARRAVARLEELDDFLLRDIGVTRGDIAQAATTPLRDNAALVLQSLSRERRYDRHQSTESARPTTPVSFSPIRVS
jgi:uncharacterized protein YjiS (DUF1127 family)